MLNKEIDDMHHELFRLAKPCKNFNILQMQIRIIHKTKPELSYIEHLTTLTHIYNHIHFIVQSNKIKFMRKLLKICKDYIKFILDGDFDYCEEWRGGGYSEELHTYIIHMIREISSKSIDILITELSHRLI